MGDVIDLPVRPQQRVREASVELENDPYYRFIRNVLITADACGFELPFSIESATQHVYLKTRDNSELARLLRDRLK